MNTEMIEKMKKNEKVFSRLNADEQQALKDVDKGNCVYWSSEYRQWATPVSDDNAFTPQDVYRVCTDYIVQSAVVRCEVYECNNQLRYHLPGYSSYATLNMAVNDSKFMYFEYANGNKSTAVRGVGCTKYAAKFPAYVVFKRE